MTKWQIVQKILKTILVVKDSINYPKNILKILDDKTKKNRNS